MKKTLEVLIIGIIASLIAGLILAPHLIPVFWKTYRTELYIAVLLITILGLLYFIWERSRIIKKGLAEAFDVSTSVKKLTPADFHITNYSQFYIERESDEEIENLLKERKYVFITGIPMLGKTRMAYEASKKLKGFYLLKPQYEKIDIQKLKLPFFKKKIVLFLDDLNKYVGKFDVDNLIRKLKKESKNFVLIATCRSGKEFDQVFAKKEMEALFTQCQKGETVPRKLEPEEEGKLATVVGKRLEEIGSDGTPGSITIDLRHMKERYEQLGYEKFILKCLKLLREGYIFLWKENLVKEVSKDIFDLNIERTRWDGYLKSLLRNGFINKSRERISISHDVYLDDRFLDDYSVEPGDLRILKEVLFLKLKDAENLFYLGNGFYYKKNLSEGVDCYQKSIQIDPDSVEAHYNLGKLLNELKRYDEAEKEYREALRINLDYAEAHNNLGVLLYALERYDEAEKEYKEALRINPDDAEAHYNLGILLNELKRYDEAEKEYKEALRVSPDYADVHNGLGALFYELKRYKEAEEEYREALRINPDFAEAHNNLGALFYELKKYKEAEEEYREALRINPDYAKAHNNLGALFYELKRYEEAEKEYKEALRINPDDAGAHNNLGVLLKELKRYEEAEKEYKEALRINPDYAKAHYNLGLLLMALNRKEEAKKEFEIARDLFRKQGREEDAKEAEGFLKEL